MSQPTPANSGTSINTLMGDLNVTAPFTPGEAPEDWPELTASSENVRQADPRPQEQLSGKRKRSLPNAAEPVADILVNKMGKPDLSERCYTAYAKLRNATSSQIRQEVARDFLRKYLEMRVFPAYLQASFKQPFGTENEALSNRWKAVQEDCKRNLLQLLLDETIRLSQLHSAQIGPLRQAMRQAAENDAELKEAKAALNTVTEKVKTSETRNKMAKLQRDIKASRHPQSRRTLTAETEPRPSKSGPPRRENREKDRGRSRDPRNKAQKSRTQDFHARRGNKGPRRPAQQPAPTSRQKPKADAFSSLMNKINSLQNEMMKSLLEQM